MGGRRWVWGRKSILVFLRRLRNILKLIAGNPGDCPSPIAITNIKRKKKKKRMIKKLCGLGQVTRVLWVSLLSVVK